MDSEIQQMRQQKITTVMLGQFAGPATYCFDANQR
jgi:hypothetical protein